MRAIDGTVTPREVARALGGRVLPACAAESCVFSAHCLQFINNSVRRHTRHDNHLRDAVANVDMIWHSAVVEQQNLNIAAIVRVDHPGASVPALFDGFA